MLASAVALATKVAKALPCRDPATTASRASPLVPRVPELRFAGRGGFAMRSADTGRGFHHRVGEEHLPLDGADRENREAAVVRQFAEYRRRSSAPPGGAAA